MLLQREDKTFTGGILDVICILHNEKTNRYHAAFFEESPLPGKANIPIDQLPFIRLKSKMHHTEGADTLEEAKKHVEEMRKQIYLVDKNIWLEPQKWDGNEGIVWVVPNW